MINEDWQKTAESNAYKLERKIDSLKSDFVNTFKSDYKGFWAQVRHINELFKTLNPLSNEERQRLWGRFGSICEDMKRKSGDEKLKKEVQSKNKLSGIKTLIKDSYFQAKGARDRDDLNEAKNMLQNAMAMMKDGWGGYNLATDFVMSMTSDGGKLNKEDRDYCWEKWKDANETINYRWQELSASNYNEYSRGASDALSEANSGDPYEAQKKVKQVQNDMKGKMLSRDRRQEIFNILDKAWQTASDKIKERKEERAHKQAEWRDRMHSHMERWENRVASTEDLIDRIRGQIDDLEEKAANARTSDFADTVRGWIQEKYDFINKLQDQISDLEEKIGSVRSKLDN